MSRRSPQQLRPESELAQLAEADRIGSILDLGNVFTSSFTGSLKRLAAPDSYDMNLVVSYSIRPDRLLYRFEVKSALFGVRDGSDSVEVAASVSAAASGESTDIKPANQAPTDSPPEGPRLAEVQLTIVSEYDVAEEAQPLKLTDEQVTVFGDVIALRVAFPYIRESLSAFFVRLGFPAITPGMIRPGQGTPDRFTGRYRW